MSIWDVATGHRAALAKRIGEENIKDYFFDRRVAYHTDALPPEIRTEKALVSRFASESVLAEALYFHADLVFIISGLNFSPDALWLLRQAHIPTAVLFTESPYEDDFQAEWASANPDLLVFTNDQYSADTRGWTFVPHAHNPEVHRPDGASKDLCDVLYIGTGWPERQALLENIDWTGIDLRLHGIWPELTLQSPLIKFYRPGIIKNEDAAAMYRGAKICLNFHRHSVVAQSLGPRVFEVAGCGAFQISDSRPDLEETFLDSIPTFTDARSLENKIRHFLANDTERFYHANLSHFYAASQRFEDRTSILLNAMSDHISKKETV
jgi:spore maturation protein CgeB